VSDRARSFVQRELETLLKAELTVLLDRDSEAGETNSRNAYRQRSPFSGLDKLGCGARTIDRAITEVGSCPSVSVARWSWNPWPRRCSWPIRPREM
jgi:hypothetical protein